VTHTHKSDHSTHLVRLVSRHNKLIGDGGQPCRLAHVARSVMQARAKQLKCESSRGKGEGGEWQKNTKQCQHGRWQSLYSTAQAHLCTCMSSSTAQAHLCTCMSNTAQHSTGKPLPPRQSLLQTSHICATSRAPPAQTAAGSLADRHSLHVVAYQLL